MTQRQANSNTILDGINLHKDHIPSIEIKFDAPSD